ncbi:MAG: hypothetical protein EBZ67_00615 [Chitinophagia bacterium]|nr:hypothetical protein [Chitinophagia bacterium]
MFGFSVMTFRLLDITFLVLMHLLPLMLLFRGDEDVSIRFPLSALGLVMAVNITLNVLSYDSVSIFVFCLIYMFTYAFIFTRSNTYAATYAITYLLLFAAYDNAHLSERAGISSQRPLRVLDGLCGNDQPKGLTCPGHPNQ